MFLKSNWRRVLRRAWSVRMNVLAAAFTGAAGCWFVFADNVPDWPFIMIGVGLNVGAIVARLMSQKGFDDDC